MLPGNDRGASEDLGDESIPNVVEVRSVPQFLAELNSMPSPPQPEFRGHVSSMTWFRGHGNTSFRLTPRLYREDLFRYERLMIDDAYRILPSEFTGLSRFAALAKMQHYGFPTRLLDVTSNPLAALYFACGSEESNGEVLAFPSMPTGTEESYPVPIVMQYIFEFADHLVCAEDLVDALRHKHPFRDFGAVTFKDIDHALTAGVAAVLPRHTNPRIAQQGGAFLLSHMKQSSMTVSTNSGTAGRHYVHYSPTDPLDVPISMTIKRFAVPSEMKGSIIRDLDRLDVNERALFPEPEYQLHYIYNQYKTKTWHGYGDGPTSEAHN